VRSLIITALKSLELPATGGRPVGTIEELKRGRFKQYTSVFFSTTLPMLIWGLIIYGIVFAAFAVGLNFAAKILTHVLGISVIGAGKLVWRLAFMGWAVGGPFFATYALFQANEFGETSSKVVAVVVEILWLIVFWRLSGRLLNLFWF
jgi:hypothetical protein